MKKILVIDPQNCTMCKACELACSLEKEKVCNPELSRIRIMRDLDKGLHFPVVCKHCSRPLCKEACPTDAIIRNEETGAIMVNDELCIGCNMCVEACPFGAIFIDPIEEKARICDLCGGNPVCVDSCVYDAINFVAYSESAYKRRQESIANILEQKI